ncbi:MAG: DUF3592 domain-containing protein [Chloroflexi bacterium]|nr:DUF3592 domain-containing protein [Chloroflexota bacterium]
METNDIFYLVLAALSLFNGGKVLIGFIEHFIYFQMSKKWPSVTGKVTKSEIKKVSVQVGNRVTTQFLPDVTYSYSVNLEPFTSTQIFWGKPTSKEYPKISGIVERFPIDSIVTIYYHPDKPFKSVLDRNETSLLRSNFFASTPMLILGIIFIGFIVWF